MNNSLRYSSMLKDMGLLAQETKIASIIFKDNGDLRSIIGFSISQNIFQVDKERRRKDLATRMISRLATVDPEILIAISGANLTATKLLSLYVFIKSDRLLFEYFYEIFKEKIDLRENRIKEIDFRKFMSIKAQQSETIAKWKQGNIEKVISSLKNITVDAGLGKFFGKDIMISPPLLPQEYQKIIVEAGDLIYLQAMGVILI